jgi:hypothetical protein
MKTKFFLSFVFVLTLASCGNNGAHDQPNQVTPQALENKNSSYEIGSKRGSEDLIESLYNELVMKDINLRKLEEKISELNGSKHDSTLSFGKFDERNQSYFNSAKRHIAEIEDSLLREKFRVLIANNFTVYNTSIAGHKELLKLIEDKGMTISDLHNMLKIIKTLPLIETFQKENLPSTQPLKGYVKNQDQAINLADTLTKK